MCVLSSVFLEVVQPAMILMLEVNHLLMLELDVCLQSFDLLPLLYNSVFQVVVFNFVVVTNLMRLFNLLAGRYLYLVQGPLLFKSILFVLHEHRPQIFQFFFKLIFLYGEAVGLLVLLFFEFLQLLFIHICCNGDF